MLMVIIILSLGACGGSGSTTTSNNSDSGSKSFADSGSSITIDDIVNGSSTSALVDDSDLMYVATSSDAAYYYGRFIYDAYDSIYCGAVKFKVNKENDSAAYFSDFSLEYMAEVTSIESTSSVVSSSTDLEVDDEYNSSYNHIEIEDAADRFVAFDLNFGNNAYFGDIYNAGVIFSSDFSTMAGGDDENFFFIAQKVDSQPNVSTSAITGNWNIVNFTVSNSSGNIYVDSTSSVSVGGTGGNSFTAFTGTNSDSGYFDGELALTDAEAGCFVFGYGSGSDTPTATGTIDGGFIVSADQSLAVGIDINNYIYFAAER